MGFYEVWASAAGGRYEAEGEQDARDAFARDAGYRSERDMVERLEQASEIRSYRLFEDGGRE